MRDAIELLWLDPTGCPRLRRKSEWQRLRDEAGAQREGRGVPAPELPNQPASREDRELVSAIVTRGEPSAGAAIRAAVAAGIRDDGKFAPPLLVIDADLHFGFDDLEMLKGLGANALAFAGDDEPLAAAVAAAAEYMRIPGLLATPLAVEALARRIREAFARAPRGLPADFLDIQTQRALGEHRRYQTRAFRGSPHLQASLYLAGEGEAFLGFAPPAVAMSLPLQPRFAARLIVEAHIFSDQYDPRPFALQVLAVARRLAAPTSADAGRTDRAGEAS